MANSGHLTYQAQVDLLCAQGLEFSDYRHLQDALKNIGLFRLSAYLHPFRVSSANSDQGSDFYISTFKLQATLDDVLGLYRFDQRLRLLFQQALEDLEVAFCAQVSYVLGRRRPDAHLCISELDQEACFELDHLGKPKYASWLVRYEKLKSKSKREDFLQQYMNPATGGLPIWAATEFMDFGNTVMLFSLIKKEDKLEIAKHFGLRNDQAGVLHSWMRSMNDLRNRCAHNNRIWNHNQRAARKPGHPMTSDWLVHFSSLGEAQQTGLYGSAAILAYLTRTIDPKSTWFEEAKSVFQSFGNIFGMTLENTMGFPDGWETLALWNK